MTPPAPAWEAANGVWRAAASCAGKFERPGRMHVAAFQYTCVGGSGRWSEGGFVRGSWVRMERRVVRARPRCRAPGGSADARARGRGSSRSTRTPRASKKLPGWRRRPTGASWWCGAAPDRPAPIRSLASRASATHPTGRPGAPSSRSTRTPQTAKKSPGWRRRPTGTSWWCGGAPDRPGPIRTDIAFRASASAFPSHRFRFRTPSRVSYQLPAVDPVDVARGPVRLVGGEVDGEVR